MDTAPATDTTPEPTEAELLAAITPEAADADLDVAVQRFEDALAAGIDYDTAVEIALAA